MDLKASPHRTPEEKSRLDIQEARALVSLTEGYTKDVMKFPKYQKMTNFKEFRRYFMELHQQIKDNDPVVLPHMSRMIEPVPGKPSSSLCVESRAS